MRHSFSPHGLGLIRQSLDKKTINQSIKQIAMQQPSGRPVTTRTVGGHILTALLHGRPVDLARLFEQPQAPLPTEQEWRRLDEVEALVGEKATEAERRLRPLAHRVVPRGAPAIKLVSDVPSALLKGTDH